MKPRAGELKSHVEHIVYIFEGFRLDAGRRQLSTSGGVVLPLNSRAMEALVMLVSRAGDLVTKRELLEGVWPSAVVEDNNINQCVLAIRKALGRKRGQQPLHHDRARSRLSLCGPRHAAYPRGTGRSTADHCTAVRRRLEVTGNWRCRRDAAGRPCHRAHEWRPRGWQRTDREAVLVVQLRHDDELGVAPAAALLAECLQQRPDLHLQVEVRVMGAQSGPPVWTGEYIAGANDVIPQGPPREAIETPATAFWPHPRIQKKKPRSLA